MADDKWASPSIPRSLYDYLELYCKTEKAKDLGLKSGKDVLVDLARQFVKDHPELEKLKSKKK